MYGGWILGGLRGRGASILITHLFWQPRGSFSTIPQISPIPPAIPGAMTAAPGSSFHKRPIGAHNTPADKSATLAAAIFLPILTLNHKLEQVAYHLVGKSLRPRAFFLVTCHAAGENLSSTPCSFAPSIIAIFVRELLLN